MRVGHRMINWSRLKPCRLGLQLMISADQKIRYRINEPYMLNSCTDAPNNSDEEQLAIFHGLKTVARETNVDPRFILAIMIQESGGCARAPSTFGSVSNPGLMQDHNGTASCNREGVITNPCPPNIITQMIRDGVAGTPAGDGLVQCLQKANDNTVAKY